MDDGFTIEFHSFADFMEALEDAGEDDPETIRTYIPDLVDALAQDMVLASTFLPRAEFRDMVMAMAHDMAAVIREAAALPASEELSLATRIAIAAQEQARLLACRPIGHC